MGGGRSSSRGGKTLSSDLGGMFAVARWRALISRAGWSCGLGGYSTLCRGGEGWGGRRMLGPDGKNGPIKTERNICSSVGKCLRQKS